MGKASAGLPLKHLAPAAGVHGQQSGDWVLDLAHQDHGGDDIGLEAGLLVKRN